MVMRGYARRELLIITLFMGFSAAIIQVLIIREILTLCRGNELIIGMIYSSWFLGIYAGAMVKRPSDRNMLERRVLLSMFLLPSAAALSIYLSDFIQVFIPRDVGTFYSFSAESLFAFILTLPAGFFTGFFFPSIVSLVSADLKEQSGGTVFCVESLGSFAGGILFSFLLVEHMNPLGVTSMLLLIAVIIISVRGKRRFLILAVIPVILILFSGGIENKLYTCVWNKTHTGKLIQYSRTKYEKVSIESSGDTVSVYGNGALMYTLPDRYESRGIFHLIRSLKCDNRKILLFGSGPGSLLYNLLRTGIDRLYYFDSDPELWSLILPCARDFYPAYINDRLVVTGQELKHFLKNSSERFDMIISMPPQPENIMLNRFYTQEFYTLCREHLGEQGIIICSLHGFSNYISDDRCGYIASIYAAFSNVFPVHIMTSGETVYLIGTKKKGILPADTDSLISGYGKQVQADKLQFEKEITDNFSPDELRMLFEKTQLDYFRSVISPLTEKINANRDIKPDAYWKNIIFTAFKEQSVLYFLIRNYVLIPVLIILLSMLAIRWIRRLYGFSSMINGSLIFLTGFVSISTMLVIIMLYQNYYGIVYYRLALINALFMLGLGLGSYLFNRTRLFRLQHIYACIVIILVLLSGIAAYDVPFLLWVIIPVFSLLCGAVFPVLFRKNADDYYNAASVLDSMDHFGAIAGSLLTVVFLIPLTGIQWTIILNAVLILTAFIIVFIRPQQRIS